MNIPVTTDINTTHPMPNEKVYKGIEFQRHAKLYSKLQDICSDPMHQFDKTIENILAELQAFETSIIDRTKANITIEEQSSSLFTIYAEKPISRLKHP